LKFHQYDNPEEDHSGVENFMRKADIANEICEQVGISKTEAMDLVEYVLDSIKAVLKNGEPVKIAGFGNFMVRSKGERKGRNPRTGEEIAITPRRVVTFRASQIFKKYVNPPENSSETPVDVVTVANDKD